MNRMDYLKYTLNAFLPLFLACGVQAQLPVLNSNLHAASVITKGDKLIIHTGSFSRTWQLTEAGMATISVKDVKINKEWADEKLKQCDWQYNGLISNDSKAKLLALTAIESNDSGFTSKHILVEAEFAYPDLHTFLKYSIRVYPGVAGVFTQISLKGKGAQAVQMKPVKRGINFKLNTGKDVFDYKAGESVDVMLADYVSDSTEVEYLITGVNKSVPYKLALSWLDIAHTGTEQEVIVSSVDGELSKVVHAATAVPSFRQQEKASMVVVDVPQNMMSDGSFRFIIRKTKGIASVLSEAWLMADNGKKQPEPAGDVERIQFLQQRHVPEGWRIVAYHNAGAKEGNETAYVSGRVDFIPVNAAQAKRKYAGYFNDTQHRNKRSTPLLKEEVKETPLNEKETIDWASVAIIQHHDASLLMVKESHKCVNQHGHDTGGFEASADGVSSTGTSLLPNEILENDYRKAWASWVVCSGPTEAEQQLALKQFERSRFPVNPSTDVYMLANTWGSDRGRAAATEENVLKEMAVQHYLGIDVQQVDDGYQVGTAAKGYEPGASGWYPVKEKFPSGFLPLKKQAAQYDMKLGLWFAAMKVSLQEMKTNYDNGGFSYYKLDFANLRNHESLEAMVKKIRAYELYTNHKSKVNWDVTENAPRFGYFWAKEYGAVFLENRKPQFPANVVYTPYLVLRDLWHLSKYCNLNKFQGSVQNKDMVDKESSDAYRHEHAYTAAIPLMATPLFFQETQFYSPAALNEIKTVLTAYKTYRHQLYQSFVLPIGSEPDNASWTGFQAVDPGLKKGFLHLFREINNETTVQGIALHFLKNKTVSFTNMLSGETFSRQADGNGNITFEMKQPGSFLLLRYSYQ